MKRVKKVVLDEDLAKVGAALRRASKQTHPPTLVPSFSNLGYCNVKSQGLTRFHCH
ncbi:MAG: hypothetical protein V1758_15135 [Pseudomonadota bacterium]